MKTLRLIYETKITEKEAKKYINKGFKIGKTADLAYEMTNSKFTKLYIMKVSKAEIV